MLRSALGIRLLLSAFFVTAPVAYAAGPSTAGVAKEPVVKKVSSVRKSASKSSTPSTGNSRFLKKTILVNGKRKVGVQRAVRSAAVPAAVPVLTAGDLAGLKTTHDPLLLNSNVALVVDQATSEVLLEKNANVPLPIASITKLMTALVVVEANQDMDELLEVTSDDIDREKNTSSRLRVGSRLTRATMLHIALMSSENRAASALGRHYPGGVDAFVAAMNMKAKALGMHDTRFVETTGLSSRNVASANDLVKLVMAALEHPILRHYSTDEKYVVELDNYALHYKNSNSLVRHSDWEIGLQKTGYISEAGRCLVMQAVVEGRPVVMVLLDAKGSQSRLADVGRMRKWLETEQLQKQDKQVLSETTVITDS